MKLTKCHSHFSKISPLLISKVDGKGNNGKLAATIQGLVAKVKDTVARISNIMCTFLANPWSSSKHTMVHNKYVHTIFCVF